MSYVMKDGKIYTNTLELNITHHCNLSCRACGHLSPTLRKYNMPATKILEDLTILAEFYQTEHVRLLGGEPLLHPNLMDIIEAVRSSGISKRVRIVTNGVLLWRMTDSFWERVDEVHISIYPGKDMSAEKLDLCKDKAKSHDVDLRLLYFDYFRESYSEIGTKDKALVQRIYNTCLMAHQWCCYNVHEGYFFKCPESIFLPRLRTEDDFADPFIDGIKIKDSPTFGKDLLAYLKSPEPLASCKYCLGSVGKLFPNEQVSRREWRKPQERPTEELIDIVYLKILEDVDADADNLCLRSHWLDPENEHVATKYAYSWRLNR